MAMQSNKHSQQRPLRRPFALSPRWRWLTGTILALGGGGTTIAVLTQEEVLTLESLWSAGRHPVARRAGAVAGARHV